MGIAFTNKQFSETKNNAGIVLVVTHSDGIGIGEALSAAIVEGAFIQTTIRRADESHQRYIDDPNVITINLVETSEVERRNIGRTSKKQRHGVPYATGSLTWYSFAPILLANVGISGDFTSELIEEIDNHLFLPLDRYRDAGWRWRFSKTSRKGRVITKRLQGTILGADDLCFRHTIEGAKIVLHQAISDAVAKLQTKLEADERYIDEQEFRTQAQRPVFLVARPVQCLGQKVFYDRNDLEKLDNTLVSNQNSVPRNEIAQEVERIIKERFFKKPAAVEHPESPEVEPETITPTSNIEPTETEVARYAARQFHQAYGLNPEDHPDAWERVKKAARQALPLLQNGTTSLIRLENLMNSCSMEVQITPEMLKSDEAAESVAE